MVDEDATLPSISGQSYRADVQEIASGGQNVSVTYQVAVAKLKFIPCCERPIEQPHGQIQLKVHKRRTQLRECHHSLSRSPEAPQADKRTSRSLCRALRLL